MEDIDKMDTETLIRITKQKRLASMTEAEKQIHDKLGQLSSKLSWVVEYPPKSNEPGAKQSTQPHTKPTANIQQNAQSTEHNLAVYQMIANMEDDEEDDEDYGEEDEEFNEDDLDDEDKETLRRMRVERMKKQGLSEQQVGDDEDYIVERLGDEEQYEGEEGYPDVEAMPEYGEYQEMGLMPMEGTDDGNIQVEQYQSMSPMLDNFQMIGPSVAKCLICNKIVRKTETGQHLESHMSQYTEECEEEEEDENEEDYEGEEFEEEEGYDEEPEFTAEKITDEDIEDDSDASKKTDKVCDICNKSFKSHGNMMRHRAIHTNTRDFKCPLCSKTFKLQVYLTKHLKKTHKDYKEPLDEPGKGQNEEEPEPGDGQPTPDTNT